MRLAALLLLLASSSAYAQTGTTTITCSAPTQYTNGTQIPAGTAISYKVSRGATAAGPFTLETKTAVNCSVPFTGLTVNTTHYFVAVATANGQDSAPTVAVPRPIFTPTTPPIPPLATLGGPVFSLQITKDSIVSPQVATVQAGKPCDPTQAYTFAGVVYNRVAVADVTPLGNIDLSSSAAWARCQ